MVLVPPPAMIVFAIALAARWAADVVLQPHLGTYVMDSYDVMGRNILEGHGFSYQAGKSIPTVTRAPFYPLWWAAELEVFGRHFLLLRMGEGFVDALTAALVVFMAAALCISWIAALAISGVASAWRSAALTGETRAAEPAVDIEAAAQRCGLLDQEPHRSGD